MKRVRTVSGKSITVPAAFRVPLDIYPRIVEFAKKNGTNVSAATARLWMEKLAEGVKSNEPRTD